MAVQHDHRCRECRIETTDSTLERLCPGCGEYMDIVSAPAIDSFKSFWHPSLDHEPVFINSAKTLDKELDRRNLHIKQAPKNEKFIRLPQSKEEAKHVL